MAKLLLVEDDLDAAADVIAWLEAQKHLVEHALDGREALGLLATASFDAIILDWNLPDITGLEIMKQYRGNGGMTPIIMVTARAMLSEKLDGFEAGCEDYLTKPYSLMELSARLKSLLRRPPTLSSSTLKIRNIVLDLDSHTVTKNGESVHLVPREFAFLEFMLRNPHTVFSADTLLVRVWNSDSIATEEAIRTVVKRLRKKLDDSDDLDKSFIETVPRVGYRLRE